MSAYAGKTIDSIWVTTDARTPVCTWDNYFSDIVLNSVNGTVATMYARQPSLSLSYFSNGNITNQSAIVEKSNSAGDAEQPLNTTYYYHGDQIGSARMLTAGGGWPVSSDVYYPFGQEPSPPPDNNHYKFTGKERDSETGNDYFGARYYNSTVGRFMNPDWSASPEPVPYANLSDPQSLNLYAYVANNPISRSDKDGHLITMQQLYSYHNGAQTLLSSFMAVLGDQMQQDLIAALQNNQSGQANAPQQAQQQNTVTANAKGSSVTYTYPDGSKVVLTGDHPFRDNNPGDLRSGHGSIGRDGSFAIYSSLDSGVNALGATLTGKYGDSTISDTMKAFAPAADGNDPVKYAATLASAVGVPVTTKISALTSAQLMTFQYNIAIAEGYNASGNTATYTAPQQ